jgi:predicted unusual protein kinase regulating ubiquinone biosynthesis (AarF/ABC1/UbiB family)
MELRTLQDAVPPFDDALARRILDAELGAANAKKLALSSAPIASASLGQVYKGSIKRSDGSSEAVAVKVQRPGALAAISLDIGIIRSFAEPWRRFKGLNTDLEGLVDEWGRRFVEELDYGREAANGERFRVAMESRPDLAGVVTAAPVIKGASTRRVLTTGWIDGQRLDTSEEGDVPRLCAVALAAYLAMLLDIGLLHADPHPGNLFRTADGKLCILDWGLVTPVSSELSTAILSFIAHLVSKDFEKVPADLDAMGFIPNGKREAMEDAGVASAIGLLFSALAKGGGAEGFRAELGLPDEAKIKEIRKELKGVKDMKVRREKFLEASGGA